MTRSVGSTVLRGCIDIGSNTTRLLVAEASPDGLREVLARRRFTSLGQGRAPDGSLAPERIRAVVEAVVEQAAAAREAGVERPRTVATAAVRRAPNREQLVAAVRDGAGVDVEVLSPEEEAGFAFVGATAALRALAGTPAVVVDVGGGSVQFAVGRVGAAMTWSSSAPVGSATLTERYVHGDPPGAGDLAALRDAAAAALTLIRPPPAELAVAVGGSATSLRRITAERLDPGALATAAAVVVERPAAETALRHGLDVQRVRLLPAAMALLAEATHVCGRPLQVGAGGLREGVLLSW